MNEGRPRKPPQNQLSQAPEQLVEDATGDAKSERISRPEAPPRGPLATLKNIVMRDGRRRKSLPPEPKLQSAPKSVTIDTSATPPIDPEQLWSGRLRPGEEVGRGAMGYVIRGTDTKLRRELALKVSPAPRDQLSRDQLARFIEEAQVTAQLEHPNVVPVHDIGVDPDGRVYFSMKLIRGRSLEAILDLRRAGDAETLAEFGLRRLLDVFLQACQAVEYAHARNVVHRDLKPANIMVGDFGEVLVMDWGVAKLMDRGERPITIPPGFGPTPEPARRESESGLLRTPNNLPAPDVTSVRAGKKALETQLGTVIGTPAYMSPEQATGSAVDGRADLYALGVILYEILCGQVPFNDEDPRVLLTQVLSRPPLPPSSINPAAPLALESLALRLLAKAPADRTLTLRQIRAHIQDYIEGFGRDYEKESLFRNVAWLGGAIGLFVFLVWYLTGRSIGAVLALAPPAVFNAFGWFLLVLSVRYPLWAAYVALSHRGEHDRFRPPNDEELFVSGYAAHRTFAAALAPIFQLTFVIELVTMAIAQATRQGASFEVATRALTLVRAGWANALISIFVFLFAYLMLLAAEVRYARRIDRFALFVGRAAWESTWPSFLIVVLLMSITATGLLDWVLAPAGTNISGFLRERVFAQAPNAFEVVKTLVFQGTFLIGLVGASLLVSFPFAEILASLRLPFQAADEASVRSRQQYFLRSVAFFRLARASWLYGGSMIGCLTAITILTDETRRPIATQVLYISGPWLIGFFGFYLARRYLQQVLANAPAVERMLEESAVEARREQARANHLQVMAAPLQSRLIELAVPAACVLVYLMWTGSAVDQASIQALVLPVSTKGWLLILPYALMLPVILGRDQVLAWMLRRQSDSVSS